VKDVLPGTISQISGNFIPSDCTKFMFVHDTNDTFPMKNETCSSEWFARDDEMRCNKWIFNSGERTIVNDVSC
jgi:hypothetical protein